MRCAAACAGTRGDSRTARAITRSRAAIRPDRQVTKTKKDTVNAALKEVGQRLTRLRALAALGEMADRGDFDEFLGDKAAYRR